MKARWVGVSTLALVVSLLVGANPAPPENWSLTYETNPTNSDNVSSGDDWFRQLKLDIRKRLEVEHHFGSVTSDDNGLMRVGSARCFIQATPPTNIEQGDYNNTTGGTGTSTLSATATNSVPAEKLGLGRCWLDTDGPDNVAGTADDNTLNLYTGSAWVAVTQINDPNIALSSFSRNLLPNSSFEVGAGSAAPDGWTAVNTPTISYSTTPVSEGAGQQISITAAGGADEGISIPLAGLRAGGTYLVGVRAAANAGGDTCSLRTTGGTANVTDTTLSNTNYEDLVGTFTVDGAGNTVTVILEANVDTDVCRFDHAWVYQVGSTTVHPGTPAATGWLDYNMSNNPSNGGALSNYLAVISKTYTVESPNCYFFVVTSIVTNSGATATNLRLQASRNGGAMATFASALAARGSDFFKPVAVGDTYAFQLTADSAAAFNQTATMSVEQRCPGD